MSLPFAPLFIPFNPQSRPFPAYYLTTQYPEWYHSACLLAPTLERPARAAASALPFPRLCSIPPPNPGHSVCPPFFFCQPLTNCPRFATHSEPLSFQPITSCPFCKSFVLTTIQQCRGWVGLLCSRLQNTKCSRPLSSLECAVTRISPVTPLECADPKSADRKSFRMRSSEKGVGGGGPLKLLSLPTQKRRAREIVAKFFPNFQRASMLASFRQMPIPRPNRQLPISY